MANILMEAWDGPFGLAPFGRFGDDDFAPAFDRAFALARAEIQAIAESPDAPDFDNVITALEQSQQVLGRLSALFYNLCSADSTPAREALMRDLAPKMSLFSSEITNNKRLFARIVTLWNRQDALALNDEQRRVLTLYHQMFVRAGAALLGDDAAELTDIKARLSVLGTQFGQNILAEERAWVYPLPDDDLAPLPDFVQQAAQMAGRERGLEGAALTLNRSLLVPFLQFSPNRSLRRLAFQAWTARGMNGNDHDNRAIAAEILALRHRRARLLGHENFAAFKLEPEMAKTPQTVRDLLMAIWPLARGKALKDQDILTDMLHQDGIDGVLEPWDWRYYSEKRRRAEHDLDESALKPYFSLDAMLAAQFDVAQRLFGLEFTPLDAPLYHPDARAWEVRRGGQHLAVFIGDYFARASKRSGAWCSALRGQNGLAGRRPIVVNICNFAPGTPALLSYDDARTLFHEFGHALHQMLSNVTYPLIAGTNVARDFVELPSQLFEHWLEVPAVLETHARHWHSGQPIPTDMMGRLLAAGTYDQAFATVEYLASALVDLGFHDGPPAGDVMQKQAEILAELGLPHAIPMRHATGHFAHVFTGDGYSSGYYAYIWAEVMDADAFAAFEEAGNPFDPDLAAKLEQHILSAGGSRPPEELYTAFRGRMPDIRPLLAGRGLLETA